jgi:hypothetical protein
LRHGGRSAPQKDMNRSGTGSNPWGRQARREQRAQ